MGCGVCNADVTDPVESLKPDRVSSRRATRGVLIMSGILKRFASDESGATAIEYGMIAALIAVVVIGSLKLVGSKLGVTFARMSGQLG